MKLRSYSSVIFALLVAMTSLQLMAKSEIFSSKPTWLPGTETTNYQKVAPFTEGFPARTATEHFSVTNAGYWLANLNKKPNQLVYFFQLNVDKPYKSRVFTRVTLENPTDQNKPFVYEHHLDPNEQSTQATHSTLQNVKLGQKYELSYEIFSDSARTELIEKVTQIVQAPLGNTSGCVELPKSTLLFMFPAAAIDDSTTLACLK